MNSRARGSKPPAAPLTLTPRLTHNPRADAQDAPLVPSDLDAAVAPWARKVTARDRERALCCYAPDQIRISGVLASVCGSGRPPLRAHPQS